MKNLENLQLQELTTQEQINVEGGNKGKIFRAIAWALVDAYIDYVEKKGPDRDVIHIAPDSLRK